MKKANFLIGVLSIACCLFGIDARAQDTYRTILLGENTKIEDLKKILDDWSEIGRAMYQYSPAPCVTENVSIEKLSSVDILSDERRSEYVGTSDLGNSIVISLGTKPICYADSTSSNPTWIIQFINEEYKVLDTFTISE